MIIVSPGRWEAVDREAYEIATEADGDALRVRLVAARSGETPGGLEPTGQGEFTSAL